MSKTLPFTTTNTTIKTFRHALALDEVPLSPQSIMYGANQLPVQRRARFRPNLYHRLSPDATRTVHDLKAEMGIDDPTANDSDAESAASPASATSPKSNAAINPDNKASTSKSPERSHSVDVGTPAGYVNPRGKGDARRPFPNIRHFARRGSHKRAREEQMYKHTVKHTDLSAANDPSDDFVGLTDVVEVWFVGGHGSE